MAHGEGNGGVKSDRTLLGILRCIRESEGARLTDIADELGVAKSTVHDHLRALDGTGFVVEDDGAYRLGLRCFDYGIQARNERDLFHVARPKIQSLTDRTGERTWCIVEECNQAVYLCGASAADPVKTPYRVGNFTELHHLAAGKAILAHLPEQAVEEVLERVGLPAHTDNTITDPDALRRELAEIRERGYAYNEEESMTGLRAVGAPVSGPDGEVRGAISISGPANRMSDDRVESELAELLLGTINEIEINLREF